MKLTDLTLTEASDFIARRAISPIELTRAYIERIEGINLRINSFITLSVEDALYRAKEAEDEIQRGMYRGVWHGIPIALKDLFATRGLRTTAGSRFLADYIPDTDCTVVQRLNAAGAIILGKLNMYEWALSANNANPHYGACYNPWDLARDPGGSSGGSGAALAAGLCLAALGSDTGGSTRIPAALCGVVGLKPTYGRISTRGVLPVSPNLDHVGPMARRVRDIAALLQVIAGYDSDDPYSVKIPTANYVGGLDGGVTNWRVGLSIEGFVDDGMAVDVEVRQAVRDAVGIFERLGARVDTIEPARAREARQLNSLMSISDAAALHGERMRTKPELFGPDVLDGLKRGAEVLAMDYARARFAQVELRRRYEQVFEDYDILLTPTTAAAAPLCAEPEEVVDMRPSMISFTAPFNLTGLPALSLPCGFTHGGLPIGLQLVARPWAEEQLLRAGYVYEQATSWHERKPEYILTSTM